MKHPIRKSMLSTAFSSAIIISSLTAVAQAAPINSDQIYTEGGGVQIGQPATTPANPSDKSATAGGLNAVSIGNSANASGKNSVGIAYKATASADNAVGIGSNATASGKSAVGIGSDAKATGMSAVGIGSDAKATGLNSVSVGVYSKASGGASIGMGFFANATGYQSISIGNGAFATEATAVGIGSGTQALGENSVTLGGHTIAPDLGTIAIGIAAMINSKPNDKKNWNPDKTTSGSNSIAIGANSFVGEKLGTVPENEEFTNQKNGWSKSQVVESIDPAASVVNNDKYAFNVVVGGAAKSFGYANVSLGGGAEARNNNGIALGTSAISAGDYATALGDGSLANKRNSIAVGAQTNALEENAMALGSHATASVADGISLGSNTSNNRADGVYGYDFKTGKLKQEKDFDAQDGLKEELADLSKQIDSKKIAIIEVEKEISKLGIEERQKKQDLFNNERAPLVTAYQELLKQYAEKQKALNDITLGYKSTLGAGSVGNANTSETRQIIGVAAGSEDTDAVNVKQLKDMTLRTVFGQDAIGIDVKGAVAMGGSSQATGENSVALGSNSKALATNSVAIGAGSETADKYETTTGFLMSEANKDDENGVVSIGTEDSQRRIVHVAAGANDDDAVNVAQLKKLQEMMAQSSVSPVQHAEQMKEVARRMDRFDNRLDKMNKEMQRGLASSAAISGLYQPYGLHKYNFTASVGGYKSTMALAVGTGYRFTDGFSAKGGVAYSGHGDLTYNASMNLEW